ncbi:MAG: hypothetical protein ACW99F_12430 [Candidatus Hodarchaeales archaeon]
MRKRLHLQIRQGPGRQGDPRTLPALTTIRNSKGRIVSWVKNQYHQKTIKGKWETWESNGFRVVSLSYLAPKTISKSATIAMNGISIMISDIAEDLQNLKDAADLKTRNLQSIELVKQYAKLRADPRDLGLPLGNILEDVTRDLEVINKALYPE